MPKDTDKKVDVQPIYRDLGTNKVSRDLDAERSERIEYWEMQQRNGTYDEDEEWERD